MLRKATCCFCCRAASLRGTSDDDLMPDRCNCYQRPPHLLPAVDALATSDRRHCCTWHRQSCYCYKCRTRLLQATVAVATSNQRSCYKRRRRRHRCCKSSDLPRQRLPGPEDCSDDGGCEGRAVTAGRRGLRGTAEGRGRDLQRVVAFDFYRSSGCLFVSNE